MKLRKKNKTKRQKAFEYKHLIGLCTTQSFQYKLLRNKQKLPSRFKPSIFREVYNQIVSEWMDGICKDSRGGAIKKGISVDFPSKKWRATGKKFWIVIR